MKSCELKLFDCSFWQASLIFSFCQLSLFVSQTSVRIQLHPSLLRRPPGAKLNHGALEISYNACGILAHLMSDDEEEWVLRCLPRDDVKKEMFNAILSWDHLGTVQTITTVIPFYSALFVKQIMPGS